MEKIIAELLRHIGEDPDREGLVKTPKRFIKMLKEMTVGYEVNIPALFEAQFSSSNNSMVVIADIPYYSLCEHHLAIFFGKVSIAYIPNGKVLGLSKFARLVEAFARRLQIQENMTEQIANAIEDCLEPDGVMVKVTGRHTCMMARGVKKDGLTVTSAIRGAFQKQATRNEALRLFAEAKN